MKIVKQAVKHIITGAVADVVDIAVFTLLFYIFQAQLIIKAISFLVAAVIKYFGNKYWAFDKPEKDKMGEEALQFFAITLIGLTINVASFYFFVKINPGFDLNLWREVSVIFALLITAIWNFCGYKFIVFKK